MTFEESMPLAKQLATNQLQKGFDVEAFLILCELSKFEDVVPESTIDESINRLNKLFVSYYNNDTTETLKPLLNTLKGICLELYHTCTCESQKQLFQEFLIPLNNLIM